MLSASYAISPNELWNLIGTAQAPQIFDTRKRAVYHTAPGLQAVSLGLSALAADDDQGLLRQGFMVYDVLLAWLRQAARGAK